ncbi:AAA family ATPase [Actinophytocola xinjiangensis]|uniref:AAA family ATPase n=1 Tax=Actinophytocola xinjiangensis TaxID=485602 RepID=A0A7Z0WPH3_9PSEU|nr:ATP-dependent Clp protease ATP-binding subunit [Actinophytocola xinjiangensis]OLF12275.1 AAA family ATPase [Actinophytocola xinjiangensis]
MTGFHGPGGSGASPFDDFLAQFFGGRSGGRPQPIDITRFLSEQARSVVAEAATQTARWGRTDLDTEELLWAALRHPGIHDLVADTGADPDELSRRIEEQSRAGDPREGTVRLTPASKRTLLDAHQISRGLGASYIGPEHLLLALAANPDSVAGRMLADAKVTPETIAGQGRDGAGARPSGTETLDQFGRDLTEQARAGGLDPVVGRDTEIEQTVEVLSRRRKNNPVLIGEAGVGKTAIVEGLAQRIADDDVPDTLTGRRVVQLDLTAMVAGTRYRGDFEERMNTLLEEIRAHSSELIVFIDELHTVVGAGAAEGAMGAGNILKPALAKGELHIVGATTLDEYRTNIEKDPALERRFQPILVPEPSVEDTVRILRGLRDRYEAHHQVRFTDDALDAAANLADRYVTDRFLPDKAIDLMDQAGARVRLRLRRGTNKARDLQERLERLYREKDYAVADEDYERATALRDEISAVRSDLDRARVDDHPQDVPEVGTEDIADVVSGLTGIPVRQLTQQERERLLELDEYLHRRVVGQDEAVAAVAEAVRRSRTGMAEPNRPSGSFLFLGPTGVGKTELARTLAEALFGDESHLIRLDMSEYGERHTVSRLIGAPPGYVGYEEAGQLTEAVRRRPYSVVLLDEIEKAHAEVFNILLQVLDDGRLTDGRGRTVDFTNTVLVMTSNLGSELITAGTRGALGFTPADEGDTDRQLRDRLMRVLRDSFRPEFLNRIDEIIVFRRLEQEQLSQITRLMLEQTTRRAHAQDIALEFTDAAVAWLSRRGHQPEFGARPMRRTIQREVDNRLSRMMLDGTLEPGTRVLVDTDGDELRFDTTVLAPTG